MRPDASVTSRCGATSGDGVDPVPRARGRPKLGVIARAITLLPRHWEWLATQPGGASVALRKLVDAARRIAETRRGFTSSSRSGRVTLRRTRRSWPFPKARQWSAPHDAGDAWAGQTLDFGRI